MFVFLFVVVVFLSRCIQVWTETAATVFWKTWGNYGNMVTF